MVNSSSSLINMLKQILTLLLGKDRFPFLYVYLSNNDKNTYDCGNLHIILVCSIPNYCLSLRCHKCITFYCAYDDQTMCGQLEAKAFRFAYERYYDDVKTLPPRCPPQQESWHLLEKGDFPKCGQKDSYCLVTGFEIRSRSKNDEKIKVSIGAITGCSSYKKRRSSLKQFGPSEYCMIDEDFLAFKDAGLGIYPQTSPSNGTWNNTFAFETCQLHSLNNCSACRLCDNKDFCIQKEHLIPKRIIMLGNIDSTIVGRYMLVFVFLVMLVLAAADKDFPMVL